MECNDYRMCTSWASKGGSRALFSEIELARTKPNDVTFLCVLSACSHAGLVDEGKHYFDSMSRDYDITPRGEHYAYMVDILGCSG